MRIPLLAPLAAFACGIWAARLVAFDSNQAFAAAAALAGLGLIGLWAPSWRAGLTALVFAFGLTGLAAGSLEQPLPADRIDLALRDKLTPEQRTIRLGGWVRRPPEALDYGDQFVLEAKSVFEGRRTSGGILVTVDRGPDDPPLALDYGTPLEFLAQVRTVRNYGNPGAFDRVGWLASQGVYLTASVRAGTPLLAGEGRRGGWFEACMWTIRLALRKRFDQLEARLGSQGGRDAEIVRAMTLGEARGLDNETKSQFQMSGAYHVLVVSGMNVGLLAMLVIGLIRAVGLPIGLAWSMGAATAFGYALLLDSQLPVSRAAWMLAAYLTASAVYRRRQSLNVICGVALAFLCWEPDWIADAGFQLSFLSVATIAGIGAPLAERIVRPRQQVLRDIWNRDRDLRLPPEIAARRVALRDWMDPLSRLVQLNPRWLALALLGPVRISWAAVSGLIVSAAITLALAAPLAYHFQQLALAAPISNLAAAPLLAVITPVGFAAVATGFLPLFRIATGAAGLLAASVEAVSRWEGLQYAIPPPGMLTMTASLLSCALFAWAIGKGRRWMWTTGLSAVVCWLLIAASPAPPELAAERLELTAIDVGQGEALLVGLPDGQAGLVDAGGFPNFESDEPSSFDVGERIVAPYLGSRGIKRLAFLAITHADADHIDGAAAVMRRFAPHELWLPRIVLSAEFRSLLAAAHRAGINVRFLGSGDSFALGSAKISAQVCAHCPKRNDQSLVLAFDYGEHRFLLTGDIEADGEQYLLQRLADTHADVLKVPHHGSRNSASDELLRAAKPTVAVVSAGFENLYGHPHTEVLKRLQRLRVSLLRTDLDGASTVSSDGRRLEWRTNRIETAAGP